MAEPARGNTVGRILKKYMVTGILVWLPIVITIWVVTYIVGMADGLVKILPEHWQPKYNLGFNIPGLGMIAALIILFLTGLLAANVLGRRIIEGWDSLWNRIPVVKSIYSGVKKVSESLLSDSRQSFKTPVLVPFPQPHIWSLAFVSGHIPDAVTAGLPHSVGEEYISVYVPTTPNPTGGYFVMVRARDIRPVDMSVDEALKYIISMGMVLPEEKAVPGAQTLLPFESHPPVSK